MNIHKARKLINRISFAPSNLDMGWKWELKKTEGGFLLRTTFKRPDTNTGKIGWGYGRWMFVSDDMDDRGVIMTAWLCAKLIVEHELMEAFLLDGVRILDPHKSLAALAYPNTLPTRKERTARKKTAKV